MGFIGRLGRLLKQIPRSMLRDVLSVITNIKIETNDFTYYQPLPIIHSTTAPPGVGRELREGDVS